MCGITGYFSPATLSLDEMSSRVRRMTDAMIPRGPDDSGIWVDEKAGVALGFRRLAIMDLSSEGHQPMLSADGKLAIVFNGEVYNFQELRRELEPRGHRFRGHSDTEVMLAAIQEWGLEPAVKRFVGMFAFALWDRTAGCLHLVRDRLGIKPLYYGWAGKTFLFGSELKPIRVHPDFDPVVDREALSLQLRLCYIPAPFSIYQGIRKLAPGCMLTLNVARASVGEPRAYWSASEVTEYGLAHQLSSSAEEATAELEKLLLDAVRMRMIADVPLGAFLSGGTDSSLVVALMQAQSSRPVRTFTIGFHEHGYDEAPYAKAVAQHLGTDHTELYLTPDDALAVIPRLPEMYDEPFSDSSQIPTYLVSALTRRHVTVSLSGDGGDELFGGYNRYFWGSSIWNKIRNIPRPARRALANALQLLAPESWDKVHRALRPVLPTALAELPRPGDRMHKLAPLLAAASPDSLYEELVSHWVNSDAVLAGLGTRQPFPPSGTPAVHIPNFVERMMFLDLVTYLPGDILTKVDRATMAVSLEGRVPLLDHRVVEFASRVPLHMKVRSGSGKWLLRQVLDRYIPRQLMERPKMGFGLPLDSWLRGPLRDWCEELLSENRLLQEGFFHPSPIRQMWREHLSGARNWHYHLWDVLMFQAWHERWQRR